MKKLTFYLIIIVSILEFLRSWGETFSPNSLICLILSIKGPKSGLFFKTNMFGFQKHFYQNLVKERLLNLAKKCVDLSKSWISWYLCVKYPGAWSKRRWSCRWTVPCWIISMDRSRYFYLQTNTYFMHYTLGTYIQGRT